MTCPTFITNYILIKYLQSIHCDISPWKATGYLFASNFSFIRCRWAIGIISLIAFKTTVRHYRNHIDNNIICTAQDNIISNF